MDYGCTVSYAPHTSSLRVLLLLILSSRRRGMRTLPPELWYVVFITYFAAGKMATVSTDGNVIIYDLDVRRLQQRWFSYHGCQSCVLMPAQSILVTTHTHGVFLWDSDTGDFLASRMSHTAFDTCQCLPRRNVLFLLSAEHFLYEMHIDRATLLILSPESESNTALCSPMYSAISADGTLLAIGDCQGRLEIWNTEPLHMRQSYNWNGRIMECVFYRSTLFVACSCDTGAVFCVEQPPEHEADLPDQVGQLQKPMTQHPEQVVRVTEPILSFAISPNGRHWVTATARTLQVQNGQSVRTLLKLDRPKELWHCSFSPNGAYLVVLANNGPPHLWAVSGDVFTEVRYNTA
jgi:WD40 repeat protein